MSAWKPRDYPSVAPYLVVDGAARTMAFLTAAFDAVEVQRFSTPDGKVLHGEMRIDDTVVMVADGNEGWPPVAAHVHVYVPDVDATYRRALEAGGVPVQQPVQKDDPDKRGAVKDAGGTTWWMATRQG